MARAEQSRRRAERRVHVALDLLSYAPDLARDREYADRNPSAVPARNLARLRRAGADSLAVRRSGGEFLTAARVVIGRRQLSQPVDHGPRDVREVHGNDPFRAGARSQRAQGFQILQPHGVGT